MLVIALISDIKSMRIPNWLTVSFFVAGCCYQVAAGGWEGGWVSLLGALSGFAPLLVLYAFKGIGAGDVKLFAALGVWIGTTAVLQVLIYAILYGGAVGMMLLFFYRPFGRRIITGVVMLVNPGYLNKSAIIQSLGKNGLRFPFMIAVAPGAVTAWLLTGT
ncbi:prepilin peptidase [Paenibacillus oenotherae]|uniref:Prepilin peptidase n=1 Tax=Paenibacillus oenotherae TaxID=1435645 RepID=A0ABS7D9E5_9BACL|nr:prepilin peptidase [Paenibacillus oenotherae]MBW7476553.1 prepilin peptidase [Paenibacillus oenotherae]